MKGNIKITVEKAKIDGCGVIILTGPSGCGKGEIAKALCKFLSIPEKRHLSMGSILRDTVLKVKNDHDFQFVLANRCGISSEISITDMQNNRPETIKKANEYNDQVRSFFDSTNHFISQQNWLEFCVANGLLVPDEWTHKIINTLLESSPELQNEISILDGYPRTITAAKYLLDTLLKLNIPIIKILHLFISKDQMNVRAFNRGRMDDSPDNLERRYQFYVDKVQPCIDYFKDNLGSSMVSLVDAHQPVFNDEGQKNLEASIHEVILSVIQTLGLPRFLMDL